MEESLARLKDHVNSLENRADALESCVAKYVAEEASRRERDVADLRKWAAAMDSRIEGHEAAAARHGAGDQVQQLMEAACSDLQARLQNEVNAATSKAVDFIIAQLRSPRALASKGSEACSDGREAPPEEVPTDLSLRVALSNVLEANEVLKPLCELVYTLECKVEGLAATATQGKADAKLASSVMKLDVSRIRNDLTDVHNCVKELEAQVAGSNRDMMSKVRELDKGLSEERRIRHDKDREIADRLGHGLTHLLQKLDTGAFSGCEAFDNFGESELTTESCSATGDVGTDMQDDMDGGQHPSDSSTTSQTATPSVDASASPAKANTLAPCSTSTTMAPMSGARMVPPQPRPPSVVYNGSLTRLSLNSDVRHFSRMTTSPLLLARNSVGSAHLPYAVASPGRATARAKSKGTSLSVARTPPGSPWLGQQIVTSGVKSPSDSRASSPTASSAVQISGPRSLSPTNRPMVQGTAVPAINMHQSALRSSGVPPASSPSQPSVLQASQARIQPASSGLAGSMRKKTPSPPANARMSWPSGRGR